MCYLVARGAVVSAAADGRPAGHGGAAAQTAGKAGHAGVGLVTLVQLVGDHSHPAVHPVLLLEEVGHCVLVHLENLQKVVETHHIFASCVILT